MSKITDKCLKESENHTLTRSTQRIKELGEVFTPTPLVIDMLKRLPPNSFRPNITFLDPTCGNGQFLAAILIFKLEESYPANEDTIVQILKSLYGVDIMEDNVQECRERLLSLVGPNPLYRLIVEKNIVCADGLTYDYEFNKE